MCRCVKCNCKMSDGLANDMAKADRFIGRLRYLELMREIMAGPNLPKRKSVYDMEAEELALFEKEVEEYTIREQENGKS